jgi:adenosylhomocysteine nucleosidase
MRVAIIAALPGELKPLVQGWEKTSTPNGTSKWTFRRGDDFWVAVCSGMGAEAARRAFAVAESDGVPDIVISYGWAGALIPDLKPGDVSVLSVVLDAQTGEQFQLTDGKRKLTVVTCVRVADAAEKERLRLTYPNAVMVDMEAAIIARLAQMRNVPLVCIKGVSDGVGADLPDLNPFINPMGQLRMLPFLGHLLTHPRYWASTIKLGKNSGIAAKAMSCVVLKFMEEINVDRINRTGSP